MGIRTKPTNKKYREGHEQIFGRKKEIANEKFLTPHSELLEQLRKVEGLIKKKR